MEKKQFVIEFDNPKLNETGPKYKIKIEVIFEDITTLIFNTNEYKIKLHVKKTKIYRESKHKNNGLWDRGDLKDLLINLADKSTVSKNNLFFDLLLQKDQFHKLFSSKNNIVQKIQSLGLAYIIENNPNYEFSLKKCNPS